MKEGKKYYEQVKELSWLKTPKGTMWVESENDIAEGNYIQPEDETLRDTPMGVDLDLLDDVDYFAFKKVHTFELQ